MDSNFAGLLESGSESVPFLSCSEPTIPSLPPEVLLKVFQFLDSDLDICRCAQVSRHWHDVAEDPTLREVLTIDTLGSGSILNSSDSSAHNSPSESNGSPSLVSDVPVGEVEESLALLPKRCSKLVSLELRQVPPNCIDGLLASFISECQELQDLTLSLMTPPLRNFVICQVALVSHVRHLTIEAALLCNENAYEQLSACQMLESITFTANGNFNSYQFMIGLQIMFSECNSPLAKIALPEYAPLSSNTLSINLVQLICSRFERTLVTFNMWPVRSTDQVVDSLSSLPYLTNLSLFEAKFSRFSTELWERLRQKIKECSVLQISHSAFSKQVVDLFGKTEYTDIRELICVSCEFDDDTSLIKFLNRFKNVVNLEFHLHYGLSSRVLAEICRNFARVEHLTLSDLTVPENDVERIEFLKIFKENELKRLKQLSLAFIRKEEDSQNTKTCEDWNVDVARLREMMKGVLDSECELLIELDAI